MDQLRLKDYTIGQFQTELIQHVMEQLKNELILSPLIYFPIINDRIEVFLLAHWELVWESSSEMTMKEWIASDCYKLFQEDVLNVVIQEAISSDLNSRENYRDHRQA